MAAKSAAKKKTADTGRKQIPLRLGTANWRRVQMAKLESGLSLQEILWQAMDGWLKKNKYEGLESEVVE